MTLPIMLYVLIGENDYLNPVLKASPTTKISWVVPKSAQHGELCLLFFPGESAIVATARIASPCRPGDHGKRKVYMSNISDFAKLPTRVTLDKLKKTFADWKWPTYPRTYTTVPSDIEPELLRLVQRTSPKPAPSPRQTELEYVNVAGQVGAAIRAFNREASDWPRTRELLHQTTYWVFDGQSETFGPNKFVGFVGMDRKQYESALAGAASGDAFDGGATRLAIEKALSSRYAHDSSLHGKLRKWATELIDASVFESVTESKWQFIRLNSAHSSAKDDPKPSTLRTSSSLGVPYRDVHVGSTVAPRDPFKVDPDKVDRGNAAHAEAQNALAHYLKARGIMPETPSIPMPEADLIWQCSGGVFVAEVKSITDENEERQLRLGLGQVLRYRHILRNCGHQATAVLVPEREPSAAAWAELCKSLDVILTWPGAFGASLHGSEG